MSDLTKEILENADLSLEGLSEEGKENIQVTKFFIIQKSL